MQPPEKIRSLLEEAREERAFSAYALYAAHPGSVLELSGGRTSYWPEAAAVTAGTWFDIGSITKAVVTSSLFALAVDKKELELADSLGKWVPEFRDTALDKISIAHLLSHSSGLKWWHPLYKESLPAAGLVGWMASKAKELCEVSPGARVVYSDLGYWCLGLIAEKQWGGLAQAFSDRIATPLGLSEVRYGPLPNRADAAATEFQPQRKLVQGEVFDENCAALGGVCAHAGIFSTARGLAPFAAEWCLAVRGKSKWLSGETASKFVLPAGIVPERTWGYGWDTKSPIESSAGTRFSSKSFGHLGYPGCSLWIDPERESFAVFLTNRVHPSRHDERIRRIRPALHDELVGHWEQEG